MRECAALLFGPSPSSTMSENSVGQKRQAAPTLTQASTSQEVGIWLGSVLTPEELQELWVDDIDGAALLASTVRISMEMLVLSSIAVDPCAPSGRWGGFCRTARSIQHGSATLIIGATTAVQNISLLMDTKRPVIYAKITAALQTLQDEEPSTYAPALRATQRPIAGFLKVSQLVSRLRREPFENFQTACTRHCCEPSRAPAGPGHQATD